MIPMEKTIPLINPIEGQQVVLDWLKSDELKTMYENTNCSQSQEFKMGAMWGASMAALLIATRSNVYRVSPDTREDLAESVEEKMTQMCGCKNCISKIKMIILGDIVPYDSKCEECGQKEECMRRLDEFIPD